MAKKFILFGKNKNNSSLIRAMEQITQNLTSDLGLPALESVYNEYTGVGLTGAEREANDFSAEQSQINRDFQSNEAALQRDWSAAEAERARDWNEEMYYKYNSLQGKINQANEAGVNPMLAVTGNVVSPMNASSSAPSGASASGSASGSVSPSGHGLTDLLGSIMGLMKLKSEIDLNNSETQRNLSDSGNKDADTALKKRTLSIMEEYNLDVREIESRIGLNIDQATQAFSIAEKTVEECARITQEKDFFERTKDDRAKIIEYEKLIAEFESSLSSTIESLDDGKQRELSDWVGAIIKVLLGIKK